MYMSTSGAGKAPDGGTAAPGHGFTSHAIRIRTNTRVTQGFIIENTTGSNNFSVRASDGLGYLRGGLGTHGRIHIDEPTGTRPSKHGGSITLDHGVAGGESSIVFRSKYNRGSDYGYISYRDDRENKNNKERSVLIIGVQNDGPNSVRDDIALMPSAYVGIGTLNPSAKLHVVGDIVSTGNITAYYSDERLKTKIGLIKNPLDVINKLNGFYYKPNEIAHKNGVTKTETEIGLSAQDVQRVLPELVKLAPFDMEQDKNGNIVSKSGSNYLTVQYERLVPVLVESIKELNRKNEVLEKENQEMQNKYNIMFEEIQKIKQRIC